MCLLISQARCSMESSILLREIMVILRAEKMTEVELVQDLAQCLAHRSCRRNACPFTFL